MDSKFERWDCSKPGEAHTELFNDKNIHLTSILRAMDAIYNENKNKNKMLKFKFSLP